jgi:hypothetical protein
VLIKSHCKRDNLYDNLYRFIYIFFFLTEMITPVVLYTKSASNELPILKCLWFVSVSKCQTCECETVLCSNITP